MSSGPERARPLALGILGTARIGGALVHAAGADGGEVARVAAVGSRSDARAWEYADALGIPRAHGSYEELLRDPEVDAVYVALPNSLHVPWSVRALDAGRHVLCEKPLAARGADAEAAFEAAERAGRVLTEGFMYRHHPQTERLLSLVAEGAIGRVRSVRASFSFTVADAGDPRLRRDLDGGALLDVGCYGVHAARHLLGAEPESVAAEAVTGGDGVDVRFRGTLRFPEGVEAEIDVAIDAPSSHALEVVGEEGSLHIADPWHCWNPGIELRRDGGGVERVEVPHADAHRLQLEGFVTAACGEAPPLLERDDAVGQARAIEALRASSASGETVRVR